MKRRGFLGIIASALAALAFWRDSEPILIDDGGVASIADGGFEARPIRCDIHESDRDLVKGARVYICQPCRRLGAALYGPQAVMTTVSGYRLREHVRMHPEMRVELRKLT